MSMNKSAMPYPCLSQKGFEDIFALFVKENKGQDFLHEEPIQFQGFSKVSDNRRFNSSIKVCLLRGKSNSPRYVCLG